jgi:uncharacterized protein (DUF58 family)
MAGESTFAKQLRIRGDRWLARRIPAARQVRLNQRRIFILPSRAGVAFAGVLLLMLLLAINYQHSLAYALTFLLASVFVVAILHTYRNLSGLQLSAGSAPAVFAGTQARIRVVLQAGARSHRAVSLGWSHARQGTWHVPAHGQTDCDLRLPASRRGWLVAPRIRVESRFPLGLLVAWSWVDLQQRVLVYPQPVVGVLPGRRGAGEGSQGSQLQAEGCDDFQGLRTYQPGDGQRRLHWKAFSRGQGLLVKAFAEETGEEWLLDLQTLSGPLEECLSRLCQGVLELSEQGLRFCLRLPGVTLGPDRGEGHREVCLRALALYGSREDRP